MARARRQNPTPPAGRRAVAAALLRSAASAALLVTVYSFAPLTGRFDRPWPGFVIALAFFSAMLVWQIRAITASDRPRLRALEAVAVSLPLLLLIFASTYVIIARADPASFTETLTRTDALYFTITVFTTVGFGDIAPVTETARIITTIQMVAGLIVVGVVARIMVSAIETATRRRSERGGTVAGTRNDDTREP